MHDYHLPPIPCHALSIVGLAGPIVHADVSTGLEAIMRLLIPNGEDCEVAIFNHQLNLQTMDVSIKPMDSKIG